MRESTTPNPSGDPAMRRLTQELERMRDSLVELSLFLQDYQLVLDGPERIEARQLASEVLRQLRR